MDRLRVKLVTAYVAGEKFDKATMAYATLAIMQSAFRPLKESEERSSLLQQAKTCQAVKTSSHKLPPKIVILLSGTTTASGTSNSYKDPAAPSAPAPAAGGASSGAATA